MARKLTKAQQQERADAITRLREVLKPGDTVYTIVRRVGRTGMSRDITPLIFRNGEPFYLGYLAAAAIGYKVNRDHGVRMNGSGMDMCFALVFTLAMVVFAKDGAFPNDGDGPTELRGKSRGYWLTERGL